LVEKDGVRVLREDNDNQPCAILLGKSKHQQTGTVPVLTWDFDVLTEPDAILKRVAKIASFPVKAARPKSHKLDVPFGTAVDKKLRGISAVYLIVPVIPELPGVESLGKGWCK